MFNAVRCKNAFYKVGSIDMEDLTPVVISYVIYETSLWRVSYEMTTSVRFCLSYDSLIMGFYRLKNKQYFKKKCIVDTDVVNDVTSSRQSVITRVVIRFL